MLISTNGQISVKGNGSTNGHDTANDNARKKRNHQESFKMVAMYLFGLVSGLAVSPVVDIFSFNLGPKHDKDSLLSTPCPVSDDPMLRSVSTGNNVEVSAPSNEGWKLIHVFYGNNSHIDDVSDIPSRYFRANEWFSQYRQDEIVTRLLNGKRNGYFIDLASNDALRISNTYALETYYGWNGICLEPNSIYWNGLAYRKCDVAAAVIGMTRMEEVAFNFPKKKAPQGGIVGNEFRNKVGSVGDLQRRYTVKLIEVLRRFGSPTIIDYLSLDIEGAEDLVMSAFPFDQYRFNILTVERPSESLSKILESNGYELLKMIVAGKESIWVHTSVKDSLNMAALSIDAQTYSYRENKNTSRIAPEEMNQ